MWKTPSSAAQIWLFSSRIQPGSHGSKNATNQHYKDAAINLFCKHVRWMLKYSNVSQKQRIPRNLDRARADNLWVLIVVAGCDKPKCSQTELGSFPPLVNAPSKWEWKIAHENVHIKVLLRHLARVLGRRIYIWCPKMSTMILCRILSFITKQCAVTLFYTILFICWKRE